MSMTTTADTIKTALQTLTALKRVFGPDEIPDSIQQEPSAVILVADTEYQTTLTGGSDYNFRVLILASRLDTPSSLSKLLPLMEPDGASSIPALMLANNRVKECTNAGMGATIWGGIPYLSTEFQIKIMG